MTSLPVLHLRASLPLTDILQRRCRLICYGWKNRGLRNPSCPAVHGTILATSNCRLEGNQNTIIGRIQIHTNNKGLIKEELNIKVKGRIHKVSVVKEVRDISHLEIQVVAKNNDEKKRKRKGSTMMNDMILSEAQEESSDDSNSEDDDSSDDDDGRNRKQSGGTRFRPMTKSDDMMVGKDEVSSYSSGTTVQDNFDGENVSSKNLAAQDNKKVYGEYNERDSMSNLNFDRNISVQFQNKNCKKENVVENRENYSNEDGPKDVSFLGQENIGGLDMDKGSSGHNNVMGGLTTKDRLSDKHLEQNKCHINGIKELQSGGKQRNASQLLKVNEIEEEQEQNRLKTMREKRGVSLSSSVKSGGNRSRKKRKSKYDEDVVRDDLVYSFNQGVGNDANSNNKRMIGRRRDTKATKVARHTGVEGAGKDKKGVLEAHKEYYKKGDGEMIGVSWAMTEDKPKEETSARVGSDGSKGIVGMGEFEKEGWVSSIHRDEHPDVIGLQETKCDMVDEHWVEVLWGGKRLWFRVITGKQELMGYNFSMGYESFHVPHISRQKSSLYERLAGLMDRMRGAWCIFGDLNVIPMGGQKFSRVSDDCMKFSKLDRFLLNEEFYNLWDFGPKPFRVFDVWLEDFYKIVNEAYKKEVRSNGPDCRFRDKVKNVKDDLKKWSKERFGGNKEKMQMYKNEAMRWELESENRTLTHNERLVWLEARKRFSLVFFPFGTSGTHGLEPVPSSTPEPLERADRLLALDALAVCLPFAEVVNLGLATVVGGVMDVSEILLLYGQQSTKLLRVLVSRYHLDRGEHKVIPDIVPVYLVPPRNGQIL
nr:hypothetical protein [Tanacetum cinerariifolium]